MLNETCTCDYKLDWVKKNKGIFKGVLGGLKKAAMKWLYDSDRASYDWVYSEIIRVTRLLGGKDCGKYKPSVYSTMVDTHRFLFNHNVAYGKFIDKGEIDGYCVKDVEFGIGKDINGRVYILFDYWFTPEGEHYLVKEIMHNQICLSLIDVKFMRETEDGVFHFLTRIIDDIYRKRYGKSRNESFWDDGGLECEYIELPIEEWYRESNGMQRTFKYALTMRKSWFDEYYKDKKKV